MADAFPISGSIDPKAFPFLLMDLHRHGATGSLKVDGPSYQKALYFRGGRILFGSSNDPRDQLGAILIESGKITPEQLEDVNAKVGPGNPLAKALSDSGFVNQRELGEAARAKVERILSDVIAYDSGSFEFEDGVLPKGAVDLKLSTERVVMASVRRVSDRNFVLRHLESLEVLLRPTPAMASVLPELQSEAGGLPEQLDGRRTLKEAAGLTPLDEFEAAKVACALLFLGLAERSTAAASEMDLGQTARLAFDDSPSLPTLIMPSSPVGAPDEAPTEVHEEPLAAPEPGFFLPQPSHSAPLGFDSAETALSHPPATSEPEPLSPEIDLSAPPPARDIPAPRPVASKPPFIPRARAHEPEPIPVPEVPVPPAARSRPSKEDLAALDALLNARTLEGPMAPLEKPAAPASQGRWEPKFGQPPPGRRGARRSGPRPILLGAAAVALLGGAGGGWLYFNRESKISRSLRSAATTLPRPAASPLSATPLPPASPDAPPTMNPPIATTLAARPSATTLAARPPATPSSGGAGLADARTLLRQGKLSEAARGFAANIKKALTGSFSIQILVACSDETVQKALDNVAEPELYILPVNFKGRDCYRLCWGIYESQARADSAAGSVPEYFRKGGAAPRVVPTSALLP